MTPGAAWCSLCLAPRGAAAPVAGPPVGVVAPHTSAVAAPTALAQRTRYGHSETTFGMTGRLVMTLLLILPEGLFVFTFATGFGIVGAGIWTFVVIPWGLRDIWRTSHRPGLASAIPPPAMSSSRFGDENPPR